MENKDIIKSEQKKISSPESTKGKKFFKPVVDIIENANEIVMNFEIPGVDKNKMNIDIEDDVLTLTADIEEQRPNENANLIYREYRIGAYKRAFTLVDTIDKNKITAKYKNGILTLILPKKEEIKPKEIKIEFEK
ncbi:MAG TPA: Hsp20/alpha crystallin family protein [bacterium]|nr:Hsp20/alpha crystallin family protein [bacterium]HOL48691.1 Hsp20/alpha crystallin family protein [bacterium]HPQ19866.1 Hsp20/alpha crystallin family protein [bacterium]